MLLVLSQAMWNSFVGTADRTGSSDCLANYCSTAHVRRAWCNGHLLYLRTSSWYSFSWWCAHRLKEAGCLRCDLLSQWSVACRSRPRVFHFGGSRAWDGCPPSWERCMGWTWMHPEVWLGSAGSRTYYINHQLLLHGFWPLIQRRCRSWKLLNSLGSILGVWLAAHLPHNLDWQSAASLLARSWSDSLAAVLRHQLLHYSDLLVSDHSIGSRLAVALPLAKQQPYSWAEPQTRWRWSYLRLINEID